MKRRLAEVEAAAEAERQAAIERQKQHEIDTAAAAAAFQANANASPPAEANGGGGVSSDAERVAILEAKLLEAERTTALLKKKNTDQIQVNQCRSLVKGPFCSRF